MISYVNIRDKISLGLRNILNINGYYPQAMAPVAAGYERYNYSTYCVIGSCSISVILKWEPGPNKYS